jgi:hypothetical protein
MIVFQKGGGKIICALGLVLDWMVETERPHLHLDPEHLPASHRLVWLGRGQINSIRYAMPAVSFHNKS